MTPNESFVYPDKYPAEMYRDGLYRVVFSNEGAREFAKKGWSVEMEEGKERKDYEVFHLDDETAKRAAAPVKREDLQRSRGPGRPPKE